MTDRQKRIDGALVMLREISQFGQHYCVTEKAMEYALEIHNTYLEKCEEVERLRYALEPFVRRANYTRHFLSFTGAALHDEAIEDAKKALEETDSLEVHND